MSELRLHLLGGLYLTRAGQIVEGSAARRKPLALLAMLAVKGELGVSRDQVLGSLWGDCAESQARRLLKQMRYVIHRDLGLQKLIQGDTTLRLNRELCTSDLFELRDALRAGRTELVSSLYRGPLLEGIYLDDHPGFQRWLEGEQGRLAHELQVTLRRAALSLEEARRFSEAVDLWSALVQQDPLSDTNELGLARALTAAGDRAAAVHRLNQYTVLLRRELDTEPDPEVSRTLRALKVGQAPGDVTLGRMTASAP